MPVSFCVSRHCMNAPLFRSFLLLSSEFIDFSEKGLILFVQIGELFIYFITFFQMRSWSCSIFVVPSLSSSIWVCTVEDFSGEVLVGNCVLVGFMLLKEVLVWEDKDGFNDHVEGGNICIFQSLGCLGCLGLDLGLLGRNEEGSFVLIHVGVGIISSC